MRGLVAVLAVAAVLAPMAGAATKPKPTTTITAAGTAAAQRALIGLAELGPGWSTGAKAPKAESPGCGSDAGTPAGAVEIGAAATPTFEDGSSGPFVSQAAFVYRTGVQALAVWKRVSGAAELSCLARSVASGGAKGVRFEVLERQGLSRPAPGTRSSAYRVVLKATAQAQAVSAYVDVVLLGRGATVTALSFAGYQQPVAASLELALAREVARRL